MKDNFNRDITYMRLSVTELCNLRCRYCMPEDGICKKRHEDMLTEDEMINAVEAAAHLGISKVRITGGEPLIKKNIISICKRIADVKGVDEVCVTTNGILLSELAKPLHDAGVKRINISIDTLDPHKYAYITRRGTLNDAMRGIYSALEAGFEKVKINTVLIGGFNDDEVCKLSELTLKFPVDVRFIELMPMYDSGDFKDNAFISCDSIFSLLPDVMPVPYDSGVARLYRMPNAMGNVGLISPISAHFCGECNRIRLTADGKLKPCLHSSDEYSVKGLNKEQMIEQIYTAIMNKPKWHEELSYISRSKAKRNMNQIGG